MLKYDNPYTKMQKEYYEATAALMNQQDHKFHNDNRNYWEVLLWPVRSDSGNWYDKVALDFGCGTGRNLKNLLRIAPWKKVIGVDISANNLGYAKQRLEKLGYKEQEDFELIPNNGVDIKGVKDESVDYVMSTIVLQHIAVYDIRFSLLSEMFRVLKPGGTISFQMGFGEGYGKAKYHENAYDAKGTNTSHDVEVLDPQDIEDDLKKIGFKTIRYYISDAFSDGHPQWIFFEAKK